MFATQWTAPQGGRSAGRKRAWILTSSLLLHVVALATLAGAEAWQVRAVAEPPIPAVFEVQLPLPVLPPPPPPPAVNEPKKVAADSPRPASTPLPPLTPLAPPPPLPAQPDPLAVDRPIPPPADPQPADPRLAPADVDPFGGSRRGNGNGTGDATSGRGTGNGDDVALPIGGAISRPQIIPGTKVEPRYTELARQAHLQGVVVLRAVIDERGNVIDIQLLKRLQFGLDEEAVKAVSQWKFTPALLHGRPVKVFFDLTVVFQMR
jgi:protein TonB